MASTQLALAGFIKVIRCLSACFGGLLSHVLVEHLWEILLLFLVSWLVSDLDKAEAKVTSSLAIVYVLMSTHKFLMCPKLRG